jgi:malate permease and related proteins
MPHTDLTLAIIISIAEIFGSLAIGGIGRFFRYVDEPDIDRWSRLVLDFLYPAFIFSSITAGFQNERLHELWPLPLLGFGLPLLFLMVGIPLKFGLRTNDPKTVRTFLHFCIVNNYAYLPIVIVRNLWGDAMLADLLFLNLGSTLALWTFGIAVLGGAGIQQTIKNLVTPNLVATLLALIVAVFGWHHHLPKVISHIVMSAGSASIPMMLVLAGASMFKPSAWRISWKVVYIAIVRLLLLPACAILLLKLLPLSPDVYKIATIVALMPLAVSSVIFTRIYGGEPDYAVSATLVTTVGGIVTVPVAVWMLFG